MKTLNCYFKDIEIVENLFNLNQLIFNFNATFLFNIISMFDYVISGISSMGSINNFICQNCISGSFYLKNCSISIENSMFIMTLKEKYLLKYSAIYAEMNPKYFILKSSKILNIANDNNGPVKH